MHYHDIVSRVQHSAFDDYYCYYYYLHYLSFVAIVADQRDGLEQLVDTDFDIVMYLLDAVGDAVRGMVVVMELKEYLDSRNSIRSV
jgi:hypothetical protein